MNVEDERVLQRIEDAVREWMKNKGKESADDVVWVEVPTRFVEHLLDLRMYL